MYGEGGGQGSWGLRARGAGPPLFFRHHTLPGGRGECGRREGLSSLVQDLAAESGAVKPDLSTIKGTCGNPLPVKSESLGKPVWPLKCRLKDTTQS